MNICYKPFKYKGVCNHCGYELPVELYCDPSTKNTYCPVCGKLLDQIITQVKEIRRD